MVTNKTFPHSADGRLGKLRTTIAPPAAQAVSTRTYFAGFAADDWLQGSSRWIRQHDRRNFCEELLVELGT